MSKRTDIQKILEGEQIAPSAAATAMCKKIKARHEGRVVAFLYYGSSLRAMNDPKKMLDFYVLVDSYAKTHKNPLRAFLNWALPPAVYYLENKNPDGSLSTCKYSVLSLGAFERKTTKKALLSMIWGRFSQPCVLLFPRTEQIANRIQTARAHALMHMAAQITPLMSGPVNPVDFWARAFRESYKTELRPEASAQRSREIVNRYQKRYEAITAILLDAPLPTASPIKRFYCRWTWMWRRFLGKILTALRILNSAATFDGGLDYVLRKIKNHSGVQIDINDSQRNHPILWSPVLAWKLYRRGAFK